MYPGDLLIVGRSSPVISPPRLPVIGYNLKLDRLLMGLISLFIGLPVEPEKVLLMKRAISTV